MNKPLLVKKSAMLFNCVLGGIVVNMLMFFGTSLYFSKAKKALENSGLKETNLAEFASQLSALNLKVGCCYGIAIGAIIFSAIFALKRLKITKQLQQLEQQELDDLL